MSEHDDSAIRASDADRERAVASLREHHEAGRLSFEEFTGRLDEVYASRTLAQLRHSLRELPQAPSSTAPSAHLSRRHHGGRPRAWSADATAAVSRFVCLNGLLVGIWAASGAHYFWPMWVMLPTGVGLLSRALRGGSHHAEPAGDDPEVPIVAAAPPPRAPDETPGTRAVMTVLFVDIVGSTQHAASMGDAAWRRALDSYERGVETVLASYAGQTLFTKGDEVVAAFALPAAAVECAFGIAEHAAAAGLQVRAGLHAGEVERRGDRASGIALHIGQRVCAHAEPAQVLMTSTVRDLLVGSSVAVTSVGEHELKGLPEAWQLYQAVQRPLTHLPADDRERPRASS